MDLLDQDKIQWTHLTGGEGFDYPIAYWCSVVSSRDDGHIDLLFRWEPNAYCHFHRHLVPTTSLVLEGEHHVIDVDRGRETGRKVRHAGSYAHKPAGDVHMEHAGPEGSLVLFNLHAPDGRLFDMLDRDENVLMTVTIDDVLSGRLGA
jgi:hypothetical protein